MIKTMPDPRHALATERLLSKEGFECQMLTLEPGGEGPALEATADGEHLLFLVEGEATVRFAAITTMLNREETLLIPAGTDYTVEGRGSRRVRVFRAEVPPRRVRAEPLVAM